MPLPLPNLDDRNYKELLEEALALIPQEYPEWTDHNPSDTGIIIIELLAWLTEQILYSVDQIPEENQKAFISLLRGNNNVDGQKHSLDEQIRETLGEIRKPYRAITPKDFETLALNWQEEAQRDKKYESPESIASSAKNLGVYGKIGRAHCLPPFPLEQNRINLENGSVQPGHICLVVVPQNWDTITLPPYGPTYFDKIKTNLTAFFARRKLLTTKLDIVAPEFVSVKLSATIYLVDGSKPQEVKKLVKDQLSNFFAPLKSGDYWQGKGWPFGRSVYLSEVYHLLNNLRGVDYVENLVFLEPENKNEIPLLENQLVNADIEGSVFKVKVRKGNDWREV